MMSPAKKSLKALAETKAAAVLSAIDMVHRVGKHQDGSSNTYRPVIIRFTSRTPQDAFWTGTKKCDYLKNNRLRLKEDLTATDRETHSKVWPCCRGGSEKRRKYLLCR